MCAVSESGNAVDMECEGAETETRWRAAYLMLMFPSVNSALSVTRFVMAGT